MAGDTNRSTITAPSPRRRGDYGLDGDFRTVSPRGQLAIAVAIVAVLVALTAVLGTVADAPALGVVTGVLAVAVVLFVASYIHTTRVGKFVVWAQILGDLRLQGDEEVLDLGCGRGALLTMVAQLLPDGHATGIDLWHPVSRRQARRDRRGRTRTAPRRPHRGRRRVTHKPLPRTPARTRADRDEQTQPRLAHVVGRPLPPDPPRQRILRNLKTLWHTDRITPTAGQPWQSASNQEW